ncbi:MAG: AraC family transcriptional regulator [Thalassobius sp.]|nr:AraC family transcriptional regulator [Thalassovita sp.]
MADISINGKEFIESAESIIEENISNEQFGVSELAEKMHMSRSNLLRKIKKYTQLSASQFIRQVRLKKGMEMLKQSSLTVSEVSFRVGFSSSSYFIKCFREFYGYPPGEIGKEARNEETNEPEEKQEVILKTQPAKSYKKYIIIFTILVISSISFWLFFNSSASKVELEKSIAVLPFKNESNHPANLYFINGLMESTLTKLQKIKDLKVISRTSAEKYRDSNKSIPEIAKELNVNYLVEGSSQRVGEQVLLSIQLIEAASDRPIWAEQYRYEIVDIFSLQNEVAKKITDAIEAVVTPSELAQIEKKPTENLTAYDYYLQALEPYYKRTNESLIEAISLFEKAIAYDEQFSLAYADIAICYYFLDLNKEQKQYTEQINNYSDKALLYDSKSAESLVAKALYYLHIKEYRLALPHLQKALEYNPNSAMVIQLLANYYFYFVPNTSKYLEYALKSMELDIAADDSVAMSYRYLNLSNAFIQNGFADEAIRYINLSLDYDSKNYYAPYLKILISYARHQNIEQTQRLLVQEWQKDTTRLDILQETAKFFYYGENYDSAFYYFQKFNAIKAKNGLNIYPEENVKIGFVYDKMGLTEEANQFFEAYAEYCDNDQSIYKSASLAVQYAHEGKVELAIEQLKQFATESNYQYWMLLFQELDPLLNPVKSHPEYKGIIQKIKDQFWEGHSSLKKSLEEKELI